MKKCPRCGYDVKDDDKYCPHCGLDLQRKYHPLNTNRRKQNRFSNYLIYVIILFSMISIPLMYSQILGGLSREYQSIHQDNQAILPNVEETSPKTILQSFDTLDGYNKAYKNVSSYVSGIESFEKELFSKRDYTFEKHYTIHVLDNYNVVYRLVYTANISDQYELIVIREFDRAHSYNREITKLKKKNAQTFEELLFNDEELKMVNNYIGDQSVTHQLISKFSERKEEFESKKEKLGHYGLGTYQDKSSFVVYRYGRTYESQLKYQIDSTDYID